MPRFFAKVHPRFFTPHIAVAFYAFLGLMLAIFGGFKQLAIISSAATLLIYLGVVLATIKLRKSSLASSEKTFRIRGGILVPVLATCSILWLLSHLTKPEFIGILIFTFVFSLIYLTIKLLKKKLAKEKPTSLF